MIYKIKKIIKDYKTNRRCDKKNGDRVFFSLNVTAVACFDRHFDKSLINILVLYKRTFISYLAKSI